MALYDDITAIEQAIDSIIEQSDGFTPETETALQNLMAARNDAIASAAEWLCKLRANKQAIIDGLTAEITRMTTQRKRLEKTIAWAEGQIFNMYKASGEKKLAAGTFVVSTRLSTSVYVEPGFDEGPYMRETVVREPDKVAIKEALKAGTVIPGASLQTKENIAIK